MSFLPRLINLLHFNVYILPCCPSKAVLKSSLLCLILRTFGDSKHVRRLFARALTSTQDWPESIGNTWLNFERDEGTLDSYEFFMTKYKSRYIYS
jgi:hypothetical protein